jgi:hypothetical protein
MNKKTKTNPSGMQRRLCRHGKIARLPHAVREELNQRLLDGESGRSLILWLNGLPQVKAALKREFGGCAINEVNLSDWKKGGHRDWVAKKEAEALMADTLGEDRGLKRNGRSRAPSSHGKGSGGKAGETECLSDRVAGWFFPHYVAAARGQLSAAHTPAERWSVLRTVCADLASLRRSDHYVERLRIWQQKLRLETEDEQKITEKEVVDWVQDHPGIEQKIWPDLDWLTPEERSQAADEILGISAPFKVDSDVTAETPAPAGKCDAPEAKNETEN